MNGRDDVQDATSCERPFTSICEEKVDHVGALTHCQLGYFGLILWLQLPKNRMSDFSMNLEGIVGPDTRGKRQNLERYQEVYLDQQAFQIRWEVASE